MRANTSRELRLAFDSSVEQYDAGRPRFDSALVRELSAWADLHAGDPVLEVGAGTGQLTRALLEARFRVVAIEPGPNMAASLQHTFRDRPGLSVAQALFEDYESEGAHFAAVVSANAFHWVDPTISYAKAARLLQDRGCLGLVWNFPILADAHLQRRLNDEAFVADLADFRRDPDGYGEAVAELLAAGRAELKESGWFEDPRWELKTEHLVWTTNRYVSFLCSLANGVALAQELNGRARAVLGEVGELGVDNYVYLGVARRR